MLTGAQIILQFEQAEANRKPLEGLVKDCYKYTYPIRGIKFSSNLFTSAEVSQQQAKSLTADIYDSTAADSCRTLASALVSGMTPASNRWFGWKTGEDFGKEATDWLDSAAEKVHSEIHSSNFDAPNFEAMLDVSVAGMACLYIEDGEETTYNFELWPLYSVFFASSRRAGPVDIVYRPFSLTALQAVNEYGEKNLPAKVVELAKSKPQEYVRFVMRIAPKEKDQNRRQSKIDALQPFESIVVYLDSKKIVARKGYYEFPLAIPRWLKLPDSCYAQGPMADALPDVKTLNELERLTLGNMDMQVSGMWGAVDDGVINPKTIRIGARRVIFMRDKESFFPLNPPGRTDQSTIKAEEKRRSIRRVLMADMLESATPGPAKTATEWHYRINLIRQLLGPTYGRLQSEYLQTLVFRCFGIAMRKGILGQPPESLRGKELHLRYVSPLARAAQNEELVAMEHHETVLLNQAGAGLTSVLDTYDFEEAALLKANYGGVPAKLIRDKKSINKIRDQRKITEENQRAQQAAVETGKGKTGNVVSLPNMGGVTA